MNPTGKYIPFEVDFKKISRAWPSKKITIAPIWCSVDLRDGNQALFVPMTVLQKIEMFKMLVKCGFKEIEVGFPAASDTEFVFIRKLIDENLIPEDVTIQVLVQARQDLIKRTIDSLIGARKIIIHMYNSTSPAQREIVFGLEKSQIIGIALAGTQWVKNYSRKLVDIGTHVRFQYSPESFSATETAFALAICRDVAKAWEPTGENKIIFNLPDTVQVSTPNIYADQVEWFCENLHIENSIISIHTHNDRGTGVAATELGLLAGAQRVEGTLFGNGERTGNCDIVTVALNLFTSGVDPLLDFSNIPELKKVYEECTGMEIPSRQPYSGSLVHTAFSGSHQDAIRKGLKRWKKDPSGIWPVPYLHIDPLDIGFEYREVIRVNGQSGKGGIAFLLESLGINLPKDMQKEFGVMAGKEIDVLGREVNAEELRDIFWAIYVELVDYHHSYRLSSFSSQKIANNRYSSMAIFYKENKKYCIAGVGNGPIDAFIKALADSKIIKVTVVDQAEHALSEGQDATAIAYVKLSFENGQTCWGAGVDTNIELASIRAIFSALNRKIKV